MCASLRKYPSSWEGLDGTSATFPRCFHTMGAASRSDICNFFSLHALPSKSNLLSGCLRVVPDTYLPDKVASFILALSPSPQLLHLPRWRQREGRKKKVYQIFLSSFTLNCLWVGSSAPVGPLLIPHRIACLSVMNPPCPNSLLLPSPHSLWRFLFESLHIYFNTHFNPCTCGFSSELTSYFASSPHIQVFYLHSTSSPSQTFFFSLHTFKSTI